MHKLNTTSILSGRLSKGTVPGMREDEREREREMGSGNRSGSRGSGGRVSSGENERIDMINVEVFEAAIEIQDSEEPTNRIWLDPDDWPQLDTKLASAIKQAKENITQAKKNRIVELEAEIEKLREEVV